MIKSKIDYQIYLNADLKQSDFKATLKAKFFNEIWRYQRLLRKQEYYKNCKKGVLSSVIQLWLEYTRKRLGNRLGFSIPCNVFGPGLSIAHVGTIVVNPKAKIGKNCRIHVCVNIGAAKDQDVAPVIGNNVYIGPGAKLFGAITLGDNISIGANAVVNKSFPEGNCTLVGVPAKKVL
ncbi:MAG: serine acetyltransferase [Saccharospirillaceae bacterium]|nr:serine acetyltransferase [Saccharospirillaceae bacterium]